MAHGGHPIAKSAGAPPLVPTNIGRTPALPEPGPGFAGGITVTWTSQGESLRLDVRDPRAYRLITEMAASQWM